MRTNLACFAFASLVTGFVLPLCPAHAAGGAVEEAREHFRKGEQWFDLGRWNEAIEEFEKAYSMRNDPVFLHNMAQACRRKGDAKRALDLYKNYLMKAPRSPQRAEVEERIAQLQKQLDESDRAAKAPAPAPSPAAASAEVQPLAPAPVQPAAPAPVQPAAAALPMAPGSVPPVAPAPAQPMAPAPAPAPTPTPTAPPAYAPMPASGPYAEPVPLAEPAPAYVQAPAAAPAPSEGTPGRGLRIAGIITLATGTAALVAGAACGAAAVQVSNTVQSEQVFNPQDDDLGKLYQNLQWVGYGVGAALVVSGSVLYIIGAVAGKKASVALVPSVSPSGAGLSAQGVF